MRLSHNIVFVVVCIFLIAYINLTLSTKRQKSARIRIAASERRTDFFISRNELEFSGEDATLAAELHRRMAGRPLQLDAQGYVGSNSSLPDEIFLEDGSLGNRSLRRGYDDIGHHPHDPQNYTVNFKILDMMRQAVYSTQTRLEELDSTINKYRIQLEFRVGFMFKKLDEWMHDMYVLWSIVSKYRQFRQDPRLRRFRTYKQLLYYATMLRRDIDITYLVEEIIRLQIKIEAKKKNRSR